MSVEGGGVSAGGSIGGGSVGGIGSSGSIGGLEGGVGIAVATAPVGISSFSLNIVNEGPVTLSFLENTMPLTINRFNPAGEIIFNPLTEENAVSGVNNLLGVAEPKVEIKQSLLIEAETVAQQAWENHPVTQAEEVVASMVNPINGPAIDYLTQPALEPSPILDPVLKTATVIQEQVSSKAQVVLDPAAQIGQAEQIVENILVVEEVKKPQKPKEQEEETELRIKHVEDEEVSQERKREIKEAVGKTSIEAQRLGLKRIFGWMVAKFLPPENEDNRSQIVKRSGPDGSYQETFEAISSSGEFSSEEEAVARFNEIVAEKKPVKRAKDGNQVTRLDIARVLKYLALQFQILPEVVEKRVVKKTVVQPVIQNKETKKETSLADFPSLAEVFQKAA